jgi:hypothetical protein
MAPRASWKGYLKPLVSCPIALYPAASSSSKLPTDVVGQLSMFGLIEVRNGRYGFRDLAAARQAAQLLGSGIGLSVITKGLTLAVRGPARFGAHSRSLYSRRPSTPMRCMR